MGSSKSSSKREVYSNKILPQETRKTLKRQPNFTPKTTGKRRTTTKKKQPKISRRKEIINIWAEINKKYSKEIIVKINETKSWFFEEINKIEKPLVRLTKKKRDNQIKKKLQVKKEKLQQTVQKYKVL